MDEFTVVRATRAKPYAMSANATPPTIMAVATTTAKTLAAPVAPIESTPQQKTVSGKLCLPEAE
jgi:hypothetical protein